MQIRSPRVLAALLLASGLTAVGANTASADIHLCRSDPILHLSNGASVHVAVTVNDSPSDVQTIQYVVHGPVGTSLQSISPSAGAARDVVTYQADSAGSYSVTVTAQTGRSTSVSVEEHVPGVGQASGSGPSGTAIALSVG
ncbi:MAG TPA: hypothetical protein VFB58_11880 [Chloroflexota bacterium]|nr:hypothetical protein [Chloroflexota bacterium]